jgi:hypothetical protein
MLRGTVYIEHKDGRITRQVFELPQATTPEEFADLVIYKSGTLFQGFPMTDGAVVTFGPIGPPWRRAAK